MFKRSFFAVGLGLLIAIAACEGSNESSASHVDGGSAVFDAGTGTGHEAGPTAEVDAAKEDSAVPADGGVDAKVTLLPDGLVGPLPYLSKDDSPFKDVLFASYSHFEDWEDGLVNTPGVTPSSTQLGSSFGFSLIDSVDGDDGKVDGACVKIDGTCNSGFAGGTIDFVFDATPLGQLPTHVGIVWTDGATNCSAIFEAYDGNDVLIGTRTAEMVGDSSNTGTVPEDRFFGVVHAAGVKKIVVTSSSGGVEVDHLHYGR